MGKTKSSNHSFLFIVIVFIVSISTNAQNRTRNSFWAEIYFLGPIAPKWSWQMELHYRRQADANTAKDGNVGNVFKNPYQHLYRPWIHYQPNKKWRLSISPLMYGVSFSAPAETHVRTFLPDFRISLQAMYISRFFKRLTIHHRFRYEYRIQGETVNHGSKSEFDYDEPNNFPYYDDHVSYGNIAMNKHRARYMLRFMLPLGKQNEIVKNSFYLIGWNETYLSFGEHVKAIETFDQNRAFLLLGYKLKSDFPMRLEFGYGLRSVQRVTFNSDFTTKRAFEENSIIQVYLWFDNINLLFKRKK